MATEPKKRGRPFKTDVKTEGADTVSAKKKVSKASAAADSHLMDLDDDELQLQADSKPGKKSLDAVKVAKRKSIKDETLVQPPPTPDVPETSCSYDPTTAPFVRITKPSADTKEDEPTAADVKNKRVIMKTKKINTIYKLPPKKFLKSGLLSDDFKKEKPCTEPSVTDPLGLNPDIHPDDSKIFKMELPKEEAAAIDSIQGEVTFPFLPDTNIHSMFNRTRTSNSYSGRNPKCSIGSRAIDFFRQSIRCRDIDSSNQQTLD